MEDNYNEIQLDLKLKERNEWIEKCKLAERVKDAAEEANTIQFTD